MVFEINGLVRDATDDVVRKAIPAPKDRVFTFAAFTHTTALTSYNNFYAGSRGSSARAR